MGSQFTEVHKMFYADWTQEDQDAADAAAREEAALYERNNAETNWDDWGDEAEVYASIDAAEEAC